jgi:myo-inositol 2-dehydrogenase/D-chiro-inositol 1-dehydrogenase
MERSILGPIGGGTMMERIGSDRIGLGLIGCGGIARSAHLPAMVQLQDRVVLRATADIDAQAAALAAEGWGAAWSTDYRDVLARPDIQAVVIATPEYLHADQVEAAASAGKHVLCEKPIAPSLAEADRMIAACASAGVNLLVGHSRRFTRRYLEVRAALDRGEIGTLRLFRENERRSRGRPQVWWTPAHWTGNPQISGGAPMMNAIHEADLMRWFIGHEAESVDAEINVTIEGNVGVTDFISLTVRFAGGAIGSAEVLNCAPPGYPAFHQLELYGTHGAIRARDHELTGLTRFGDHGADFPAHYHMLLHNLPAYARELAELVDAIRTDRPVFMPPSEARAALAITLAAVRSAHLGRTVHMTELAA